MDDTAHDSERPRRRWTRADQLGTEFLLAAFIALTALAGIVLPLLRLAGVPGLGGEPARIPVRPDEPAAATVEGLTTVSGTRIESTGEVALVLEDPAPLQRLALEAPMLLTSVLAIAACAVLLRLVRTLRRGDPFIPRNASRLMWLALLVIAGALIPPMLRSATGFVLYTQAVEGGSPGFTLVSLTHPVQFSVLLVGLLLLALAEVFRRGARMREDLAGVV